MPESVDPGSKIAQESSLPGAPAGPAPGPGRKLPTGVKILIGCLGVLGVGAVLLVAALAVGGFALKRGVDSVVGGIEEQERATEVLARLERERPFRVPEDGLVTPAAAERYLAVTAAAWERIRGWAEELEELEERRDAGEAPGLRDMAGGVRAMGGFARSRVELARALDAEGMSIGEYAWTGIALQRASEVLRGERPPGSEPAANVALARAHAAELPDIDGEGTGPRLVPILATIWARTAFPEWRTLGLEEGVGG